MENPIITVAIPPIIIWPSAPILNKPALKASEIPNAANIRGVAAIKVSEIAFKDPKEPTKRLLKATIILLKFSPVANRKIEPINKARIVAKIGIRKISSKSKFSAINFVFK